MLIRQKTPLTFPSNPLTSASIRESRNHTAERSSNPIDPDQCSICSGSESSTQAKLKQNSVVENRQQNRMSLFFPSGLVCRLTRARAGKRRRLRNSDTTTATNQRGEGEVLNYPPQRLPIMYRLPSVPRRRRRRRSRADFSTAFLSASLFQSSHPASYIPGGTLCVELRVWVSWLKDEWHSIISLLLSFLPHPFFRSTATTTTSRRASSVRP